MMNLFSVEHLTQRPSSWAPPPTMITIFYTCSPGQKTRNELLLFHFIFFCFVFCFVFLCRRVIRVETKERQLLRHLMMRRLYRESGPIIRSSNYTQHRSGGRKCLPKCRGQRRLYILLPWPELIDDHHLVKKKKKKAVKSFLRHPELRDRTMFVSEPNGERNKK